MLKIDIAHSDPMGALHDEVGKGSWDSIRQRHATHWALDIMKWVMEAWIPYASVIRRSDIKCPYILWIDWERRLGALNLWTRKMIDEVQT